MKLKPISTIPEAVYHADPCPEPSLSASIAKVICQDTPLHARFQHPRLTDQPVTSEATHFDIGSAAHMLLLEGKDVAVVVDAPDWRTKAAREERDAARASSLVPILKKDHARVCQMVDAARNQLEEHKDSAGAFTDGKPEQTVVWQEANGIWCRARLDWLSSDRKNIWDYKTTSGTANPEVVSRNLFSNGYDIQSEFYRRGLMSVDPLCEPRFRFVVQETFPPYALSVIELDEPSKVIAYKKVEYAIETWGECLSSGRWPGYPQQTCYATLPPWEEARWLEKEMHTL